MDLLVVGLNHHTAPVEIRERLAFADEELPAALETLMAEDGLREAMILSTCNRVEVWAAAETPADVREVLAAHLAKARGVDPEALRPLLYAREGLEAVAHLFRVAASLDSMVVGEPQILGQVKAAYARAHAAGAAGPVLSRAVHAAFRAAKRIRTETAIARSAVSVSYAAVELARKIFGDLGGKVVLLLGAGEMSELAARHFRDRGIARLLVANRTPGRAEELARQIGGEALPSREAALGNADADIVLCSTAAPGYLVTRADAQRLLAARRHRPVFFIDIAVPRNVEPSVNELDGAYLYDIDDLQAVVESNRKEREREAERAEALVLEELEKFAGRLADRAAVPTIRSLRERVEEIRQEEVTRTLVKLKDASPETRAAVEALSASLVNKILHTPIQRLKLERGEGGRFRELVRDLFDLGPEEGEEPEERPPDL
ncbi:MAG: glutamyl-tRNA reductase [Candidatus Rokubacteria bacterium]|nr:glutamyl-tRNA reductase [Candidatus Rokubacteria bacterium]